MTNGVTVHTTLPADQLEDFTKTALADHLPERLANKDATLWGPDAEAEAVNRLGWLDLPRSSEALLPKLVQLREELRAEGLDRIVLAGMGGSSLAPEVITRSCGADLVVLDSTDPGQVATAFGDLHRTVVVISSKSGGTIETDSHRRAFTAGFLASGLSPAETGQRFIAVTDPGSPLEDIAKKTGFREVILADPTVGGRYSALSAFGLVPSALAGVEVGPLLSDARALTDQLSSETNNPGLELGLALAAAYQRGEDKVVLLENGPTILGFGDWAEQLIAESTGKRGRGLLPVVVESASAPDTRASDALTVSLDGVVPDASASVSGSLGGLFLLWEYAIALAGRYIEINPFDQPNVAESKENTKRILAKGKPESSPAFRIGSVEIYADEGLLSGARDVSGVLDALLDVVPEDGYLAVMAYLDRWADASAADLRSLLARRLDRRSHTRPVTFGWGPRFLHSTGQYHKGGPANGAFLQITGAVEKDLPVPDQPFTFGQLQAAQAAGDLAALIDRGRPVIRLHLTNRQQGLGQLLEAIP